MASNRNDVVSQSNTEPWCWRSLPASSAIAVTRTVNHCAEAGVRLASVFFVLVHAHFHGRIEPG